jgi:hypothetical protein
LFITVLGARVLDGEPEEWRLRFQQQFLLVEAVEWDNLYREVQALPTKLADDSVSWPPYGFGNA